MLILILQIACLAMSANCIYEYYETNNGESLFYGILFIAATLIL